MFSITSLFLAIQIAQMEMGKMICHSMSEKRDVVVCLKDMFLIQDKVVFDEKRRWGGGGDDFGPNWSDGRVVTENVERGFRGGVADGAGWIIYDLSFVEEGFCGKAIVARELEEGVDS